MMARLISITINTHKRKIEIKTSKNYNYLAMPFMMKHQRKQDLIQKEWRFLCRIIYKHQTNDGKY
jgi:hypothetical protein